MRMEAFFIYAALFIVVLFIVGPSIVDSMVEKQMAAERALRYAQIEEHLEEIRRTNRQS